MTLTLDGLKNYLLNNKFTSYYEATKFTQGKNTYELIYKGEKRVSHGIHGNIIYYDEYCYSLYFELVPFQYKGQTIWCWFEVEKPKKEEDVKAV